MGPLYTKLSNTEKKVANALFTDKKTFSTFTTVSGDSGEGHEDDVMRKTQESCPELYAALYEDKDNLDEDGEPKYWELCDITREVINDTQEKIRKVMRELDPTKVNWETETMDF
jgi:hypothetical protein